MNLGQLFESTDLEGQSTIRRVTVMEDNKWNKSANRSLGKQLDDPVDVLFGVQLGGGTGINGAVGYCQSIIREPRNTILALISDLYEGGVERRPAAPCGRTGPGRVQFITLLTLCDEGAPAFNRGLAAKLAALGVPSFACTPDAFPGLMAAAIRRDDVAAWAASLGLVTHASS